ncbi:conserved hypothetical protein [Theileria equi strain WA]|uniref:AP2/ERF domain-containing protein n=1 Tax=Theileria equi strain WA TaxID=1537102 RepID=L1LFU7_THEEQ|nr:conserved hypothetical protein [Theileria equi strain WA]EKX74287.1 conserved hypothetical protein [Theileria equi strain WA]|eukprot:XP_004833739.1 conserved hypothetical protein [Theileria equi strain WA]
MSESKMEIQDGSHKKTRMMERMSKHDVNVLENMVPKLPRITGLVYDKTLKRWRSIVPSVYSSKRTVRYFSVRKYGFKKAWLKALHHICNSIISHLMAKAKRKSHRIGYSDVETESEYGNDEFLLDRTKLDENIFHDMNTKNLDNLNSEIGIDTSDCDILYPIFKYVLSKPVSGKHETTDEDPRKLRAALFDKSISRDNHSHKNEDINHEVLLGRLPTKADKSSTSMETAGTDTTGLDSLENESREYETKQLERSDNDDRLYSLRKNPKKSKRIDENYFITSENSIEMLTFDDEICNIEARNRDSFSNTDILMGQRSGNSVYSTEYRLESFENLVSDSDDHLKCKDDTSLGRNLIDVDFDKYIKALDLFDDEKNLNDSGNTGCTKHVQKEEKNHTKNGKPSGKFEALLAATRSSAKNSPSYEKIEDQSKIANSLRPWHQCIVWIPSISRWRTLYYDDMSVKHTKTFTPAVFGGVEAAYYAAVEFRNMIDNMNGLTSLATIRRTWNKTGANIKHTREETLKNMKKRRENFAKCNNWTENTEYSKPNSTHHRTSQKRKIEKLSNEINSDDGYSAYIQEGLSEHSLLGLDAKYLCMPIPINWHNDCKTYVES